MNPFRVGLEILAAGLLALWLLAAIGMIASLRRTGAPLGRSELAGLPLAALFMTLNVVWFVAALGWHRLRGRPLPPPPVPGRREKGER